MKSLNCRMISVEQPPNIYHSVAFSLLFAHSVCNFNEFQGNLHKPADELDHKSDSNQDSDLIFH